MLSPEPHAYSSFSKIIEGWIHFVLLPLAGIDFWRLFPILASSRGAFGLLIQEFPWVHLRFQVHPAKPCSCKILVTWPWAKHESCFPHSALTLSLRHQRRQISGGNHYLCWNGNNHLCPQLAQAEKERVSENDSSEESWSREGSESVPSFPEAATQNTPRGLCWSTTGVVESNQASCISGQWNPRPFTLKEIKLWKWLLLLFF